MNSLRNRIKSALTLLNFWFLLFLVTTQAQQAEFSITSILSEIEAYKPYNRNEYPLGLYKETIEKKNAEFAEKQLALLNDLNKTDLTETELISCELLRFKLQNEVDEFRYKMYLNPIQADQGFHLNLNYRVKPILSYDDAKQYLNMLNAIPDYVDQHLVLIKKGIDEGLSQPKVIFNGYESTYDTHIVSDYSLSSFYGPLKELPISLNTAQRDSITLAGQQIIMDKVVPAFKKIKTFFETDYIPNTRTSIGVSDTPKGLDFYQNRINYYTTTTEYSADDIHNIGLSEVSRIKAEMNAIIDEVNFKGTFSEFLSFLRTDPQFYAKTGDELLMQARDIAKRIDAELPKFFKTLPRRPYGVIKVPDAIAPKYTAGRYSGPSSDTQPGFYLVNTYKLESRSLYTLPSLTAHEAVPGHHLQGSLNKELGDSIPNFRRNMYLSAYGEGWALYTEFLGNELGIYRTPYEHFGKLTYEMWRACRLVVDTGIHAKGWSREEVVAYMTENTALSIHEINTETDRYISWPGQAISYKIGEIKIRELRKRAEEALGNKFNIRDFHEIILEQGTVTLPILERRINAYINHTK
ncbi:DUF885 domain-containing protein [Maribacter hydrothermalis]|uniref:DUF885 domain-containing protein n=1 Tax=Maribacter hydrothermalis TaxID=1836467 RepID=A0A1B7Z1X0_9FLAO|nr:DUF885 domain-containing protein [Maribacter hydrothermalis]APQ18353.1 hypothetical protein BTR34_13910 [Maribacter hydrothermalis]OBR36699.1 hypothetical protein A9200_09805 [Maribacter hydrothermalis]